MEIQNIKLCDRQVFIMRGLSGSGKSTFISALKKDYPDKTITIASADHFFMKDGVYSFDASKLGQAHKQSLEVFERALEKKVDIIFVDNTNINWREMKPYIEKAKAAEYNWNIIQVETPLDVILERQKTNKNVPEEKIREKSIQMKTATFSADIKNKMIFINGNKT